MGYFDASDLFGRMNKVTWNKLSIPLLCANDQKNDSLGVPKGIIYHWTAGLYTQVWDDYHYVIVFDSKTKEAHVIKTLSLSQKGKHLWGRNGGMIGIAFAGMYKARNHVQIGAFPIMAQQLTVGARLGAELACWKNIDPNAVMSLPPRKIINDTSVPISGPNIHVDVVTDHSTYAQHDGYGKDRWDIGPQLLSKVKKLLSSDYNGLKAGKNKFTLLEIIKE